MGKMLYYAWKESIEDNRKEPAQKSEKACSIVLPVTFRKTEDVKGLMAWDGFFLADPDLHVVSLSLEYMKRIQSQVSCGQCIPCRVGTKIMAEIIERITQGQGRQGYLEQLLSIGNDIRQTSKCTVGKTAPVPILKSLELLKETWQDLIDNPRELPSIEGKIVSHVTAPCMDACPAHQDIPTYIENISTGRYKEAMDVIWKTNSMPGTCGRVCVHFCESACRRAIVDEPIQIKYLKRFASDWQKDHHQAPSLNRVKLTKGPVAVIGAGPAGLACALRLLEQGVNVKVFEALPRPGGMAAVGIPDYRLPPEILNAEGDLINELGGEIQYNIRVGEDVTLDQLKEQGYKAIFIGIGAHDSRQMGIDGEDAGYEGFIHGVHFLRAVALGEPTVTGKKIVVVGGGNVAIDCVRCALRIGFTDVNLVYRRSRKEMPADPVEIEDAIEEGVEFHFLTTPTKVLADKKNKLTGIELIKMELGEPDASGRRRPVPVKGSEYIMEADCVIPAIGQMPVLDFIPKKLGLELTRWNTVDANDGTGQSNIPYIFTAGDCFTGPDSLISAVGGGNRTAMAIAKYLDGLPVDPDDNALAESLLMKMRVFDPDEKIPIPQGYERQGFSHLPPDERIHHFEEVEQVMTAESALAEASRCLRCYRLALLILK